MRGQDLPKLLKKLQDAGVAEARFHENGKLAGVVFVPGLFGLPAAAPLTGPPATVEDTTPPVLAGARLAMQVLQGGRESMEG